MRNTSHFFLPGSSTAGTAVASLPDFLSCPWFCQATFQAGLWEAESTEGGSDADWCNAKPDERSPKGLMDICIIQNTLSEFPSHSTDMIVKQLKHISAVYEVLRILFFQAQFCHISSIVFPRGVNKIVTIAAGINTVRPGFESGRMSKVKSSKSSSYMTWSLS